MRKLFLHLRKYRKVYIISTVLFVFPLILGWIYTWDAKQIIDVSCGDLLKYYGTVFGIFSSIAFYLMNKKKEEKERIREGKPTIIISLEKTSHNYFIIKILNQTNMLLKNVMIVDEKIDDLLPDEISEYSICFNKSIDEINELRKMDKDIIHIAQGFTDTDDEDYPKEICIISETPKGDIWNCNYRCLKGIDNKKNYYLDYMEIENY